MRVSKAILGFGGALIIGGISLFVSEVYAETAPLPPSGSSEEIKEVISMGADTLEACINEKVTLTCAESIDDRDVLAYEWVNKKTGVVIATTRSVVVEPKATTTYQLNVKYILRNDERIKNGDFELGESDCYQAGGSWWNPVWKCRSFESEYTYIKNNSSTSMHPEGVCKIVQNTRANHMYFVNIFDHTKKNGTGYLFVANGDTSPGRNRIVWKTVISGVVPGKQYAFSAWAANIGGGASPMLDFTINGKGLGGQYESYSPAYGGKWEQLYKLWTADGTTATIALINKINEAQGNDFTLDDISFAPVVLGVGEVEVKILPQIGLEKLADLKVCEGEDITVNANAIGSGITSYEWVRKRDGVKLSDTDHLKITDAGLADDAGTYSCTVTGFCGSKSADFTLTVNEKVRNTGVAVDTVVVCFNEEVRLSAARVTGDGLTYSWRAETGNKPGWLPVTADAVVYRKPSAGLSDAGKYRCVVTGVCGTQTVHSVLKVGDGPHVKGVSADTVVCPGEPVRLFVEAAEEGTDISWILPDNTVVSGSVLNVRGAAEAKVYRYILEKCARQVKGAVTVGVFPALKDVTVSRDTAVCPGGTANLWIKANGEGLKYSWSRREADGTLRIVSHTDRLELKNVSEREAGEYIATVTDTCGNLSGEKKVRVSLLREYEGLEITPSRDYCLGDPVKLEVTGGNRGLQYEWTMPAGKTQSGAVVNIPKLGDNNKGRYVCRISGICPGVEKEVNVGVIPGLKVNPVTSAFRVCPGENVVLRVNAEGSNLSYRWKRNGADAGSTSNTLALNGLTAASAGIYECMVHSDCGDTVLAYRVELKEVTRIVDYTPVPKYVGVNENVILYVTADGENNKYVWRQDGKIVGGNSNFLNLPSLGTDEEKDFVFTCEVAGDCGTDRITMTVHQRKFTNVAKDTTVNLCRDMSYTFRMKPELPDCGRATDTTYRVEYNGVVYSSGEAMPFPAGTPGGLYVWYIRSECGEITVRMNVVVGDIPAVRLITCEGAYQQRGDTVYVCEESNVRLRTQAEGGKLYEWIRNGVTLQMGASAELPLQNVTQAMAGRYTCRVINDCGVASREVQMIVRKKLQVVQTSPVKMSLCDGDSPRLSVEVNVDDTKFSWTGGKGNWQTTNRGYISYYQNTGVHSDTDNGTYICRAESVCGSEEVKFDLDVEKVLELTEVSKDDTVCKGSSTTLFARVNVPAAVCVWTLPDGRQFTGSDLYLPYITPAEEGVYEYHIKSRCVADMSGKVRLSIYSEPGLLKVSPDTAVCDGAAVEFVSEVTGTGLAYSWRGPAGFVSSEKTVSLPVVTPAKTGIYELNVQDICGVKQHAAVRLSLLAELKNLKISADTLVCEGSGSTMSVTHDGPATYEWWFKGAKIAESRELALPAVSAQDTGTYLCLVKGSCSTRRMETRLGLYRNLVVDSRDALVRVCPGEQVDFSVVASGDQMQYVWTKAREEVGYREDNYNINEVIPPDAGFYKCEISSVCGSQTVTYELQVKEKTGIISHSPDRFVSEHDSVRLVVRADGENNRYEWSREGVALEGNSSILSVKDVGEVDTLFFKVVVTGDCGVDSALMEIKIGKYKPLRETTSPDTLCEGSTYTYVGDLIPPTCYGDETFTYTWTRNGERIEGNGPLLRVEELKLEDSGLYSCHVSGDCGEIIMDWEIHVIELPEITSITADAFITEGASHRIEVTATGEGISYNWQKGGVPFAKDKTVLGFNPVKYEDQGIYRVTVGNICSSVSRESDLKVWRKTTIITPKEQDMEACAGTDTVFRVEALGAVGLLYKWYHNGVLMSVPMVGELPLKSLKAGDSGEYKCIVSGRGGDDSCFIRLNVLPLPEVKLSGNYGICKNDLEQEYKVLTADNKLLYAWGAAGGVIGGKADLPEVAVSWGGEGESSVAVHVLSSVTGCGLRMEKAIEYYPLPEVTLELPDTVGYCTDSLILDGGYPSGGYYLVNGIQQSVIRFTDKSQSYPVEYHYADRCASFALDTVHIGREPFIRVAEDQVVTGWCHPAELGVAEHSAGHICWTGEKPLDASDPLHPVFTAEEFSEDGIAFRVQLTDHFGCKASDSVVVSLLPSPQVYIGRDTVIGVCQELTMEADYYTDRFSRIEWSPASKVNPLTGTTAEVLDKSVGENRFVATVVDLYGCKGSDTLLVTVIDEPRPQGKEICKGDSLVVDCSGYTAYRWTDGFEGVVRILREEGSYQLSVTDRYGCTGEAAYGVHGLPGIFLPDTLIFEGQSMDFRVNLIPEFEPYQVRWQDGSVSDVLTAEKEGTYSVSVKDNIGCTAADSAFLTVRKRYIAAPDAFLPKSSADNARFYLKEVNFVSRFEMFIYDRWGEMVFKTNEIGFNGGWNGTFKGMDCQSGVYVWVAFADGKEVGRGTVVLVR